MRTDKNLRFQWGLTILFVIGGLGFYQFRLQIYKEGWYLTPQTKAAEMLGWLGVSILLAFTIISWLGRGEFILSWSKRLTLRLQRFPWIALPGLLFVYLLYPVLVMGHYGVHLEMPFTRVFIYIVFVMIGAFFLSVWKRERTWIEMLPVSMLLLAAIYNAASYIPDVSSYPLALGWSETSRYYLASTFFSESIYGQDVPWPHNHFSRYLIQSVPFLISSLPLWVHRLWQAVLRFVFPYLTGLILSRRLELGTRRDTFLFTLWAGLFFFQGPVFYQMLVMVMMVFWLFDSRKFWRSFIVVVLTAIWAGFTRINWIPMPGLMAATLYLMERQIVGKDFKSVVRYITPPVVWMIVGSAVGLFAQNWYGLNSGLPQDVIFGYLSSDLLWYRLWPNTSYSLGVLPAILIVTGAALLYIVLAMRGWKERYHPIRLLGLGMILLVLFFGGMVVSIKIGGGTNLHNFDAYLTILLILTVYLYFGKFVDMKGKENLQKPGWFHLTVIVVIPALFAILYGGQAPKMDYAVAEQIVERIQIYVDQANTKEGEILFVTQRHLITFNMIEGVELVHDYEKMILSEMAMANNQAYLDLFAKDLEAQRFSLIVHGRLPVSHKRKKIHSLAEESNVYLDRVGVILNCYYELEEEILETGVGINIFIPKTSEKCD